MKRRSLLLAAATLSAPNLAPAPNLARGQSASTLKFVPYTDLPVLDPVVTGSYAVRNHALLVFDMLYGVDDQWNPQPQMVEGHLVEAGGRTWTLRLRDGLRFHDNTPVLARDVVASIRRWSARDLLGGMLMYATNELAATDDRTVVFRLKTPFPLLPYAFGKSVGTVLFIMPERLARTNPGTAVSEIVGSGPFRYLANERLQGARNVYARFENYVPRPSGVTSRLAGPKIAHFDRVEWLTMPDPATAVAALQQGDVDWVETPLPDLVPDLRRRPGIVTEIMDTSGYYRFIRLNHLNPPFDKAAIRRAALAAISQAEVLTAVAGADKTLWRNGVGFFAPDSAMASNIGMEALQDPPDLNRARKLLQASGYRGEKTVMLVAGTIPMLNAAGQVVADAWQKIGFNIEFQSLEIAAAVQNLRNQNPVEQGGWSASSDAYAGIVAADPSLLNELNPVGRAGPLGWPDIPKLVELRNAWLAAADPATRQAICWQIQAVCFDQVPFIPVGVTYQPTAYTRSITGVLRGLALFYNVRRV
jgi:peptide/nickel transport system substrate-binding protein